MRLPTLASLQEFWRDHKHLYHYAASGISWRSGNNFMEPEEWFFASDRANLVKSVFRWQELGVRVRFVSFATGRRSVC